MIISEYEIFYYIESNFVYNYDEMRINLNSKRIIFRGICIFFLEKSYISKLEFCVRDNYICNLETDIMRI
jgi:hypothetical protein